MSITKDEARRELLRAIHELAPNGKIKSSLAFNWKSHVEELLKAFVEYLQADADESK